MRRLSGAGFRRGSTVSGVTSIAAPRPVPLTQEALKGFLENCQSVGSLAVFLIAYAKLLLHTNLFEPQLAASLILVVAGLTTFELGLRHGLMPLGEEVGVALLKAPKYVVFLTAFCLAAICTVGEPAMGSLEEAGKFAHPTKVPLLVRILKQPVVLLLAVALAVGFAAVLGCIRLLYDLSIKRCLLFSALPALIATIACASNGGALPQVASLAWDCGAVTTGPVTVPIVLSLGIGLTARAVGEYAEETEPELSGFGIVSLASLFPVFSVWALAVAFGGRAVTAEPFLTNTTIVEDEVQMLLDSALVPCRSLLPPTGCLLLIQLMLKEPLQDTSTTFSGITACFAGMFMFTLGLHRGLLPLGIGVGRLLPSAVLIYGEALGAFTILGFGFLVGTLATCSEPALVALGKTVERLSAGQFPKDRLVFSAAVGVGAGTALGMAKVFYGLELFYILLVGYSLCLVLTFLADDALAAIAWDSAGVTTGPMTVPVVLSSGLGLGKAAEVGEAFGILSCASMGPILAVLLSSLIGERHTTRTSRLTEMQIMGGLRSARSTTFSSR